MFIDVVPARRSSKDMRHPTAQSLKTSADSGGHQFFSVPPPTTPPHTGRPPKKTDELFVVLVGEPAGFQLLSPGAVVSAFSAPSSSQQSLFTPEQLVGARPSLFPPVSPSGSRRDPHGERFDSQSVCGPLSQAFWLGFRFRSG